MVAIVSVSTTAQPFTSQTITITGHAPSTDQVAVFTFQNGRTQAIKFTTDGSGNASPKFVPQWDAKGTFTCSTRPVAETNGSTAAAATIVGTVSTG